MIVEDNNYIIIAFRALLKNIKNVFIREANDG